MNENTEQMRPTESAPPFAPRAEGVSDASVEASAPRAATSCAACGRQLTVRPTGRPRGTCSDRCRRALDRATRKIRRRQAWLEEWHAVARRGEGGAAELRREGRALEADIRLFVASMRT